MTQGNFLPPGSPNRRRFLQGSALVGAAAAMPGIASAAPKRGGTLRYGCAHGSTTDSLDPGTFENDFVIALSHLTHNFLVELDARSQVRPELAEDFDFSQGGKVWVFDLRRDVEFHDGKSLTAQDVISSYNHHRGPDSTSAVATQMSTIQDMKADGKHRVIITLDAANLDFPYLVSDYHVPIMPDDGNGMAMVTSGIGCGPYRLDDYEPGVRYSGSRHPNYHKSDRAHFDSVEMIAIVDPATRTNALTSNDVDVISRADLKTVHLLERNSDVAIHSVSGSQHYTFAMRTDRAPFDNNDVRLALKLAIKRDEIVSKVLKGYGSIGNDHPISASGAFFNADLPIREYDPDQAKFHLKRAGHDSLKVQLSAADAAFAGSVDAAVLYSESAKAAGIEIEVVREPNDGYWSDVWMQKDWSAVYWGGRVVPDQMFSVAYAAGADWNDSFWDHTRFNELLVQGRAEPDTAKRGAIYGEMQQIVRDEGGVVIPMFANYVFATRANVMHDEFAGNWDMDGQRFGERWWFG